MSTRTSSVGYGVTGLTDGVRWVMNIERVLKKGATMGGANKPPWENPFLDDYLMLKHVKSNYTKRLEPLVIKKKANGSLKLIPNELPDYLDFQKAWHASQPQKKNTKNTKKHEQKKTPKDYKNV